MTISIPLAIQDLTFRYLSRKEEAIRGINLEVQSGEILLIAGPSGCGKTTLARCINGLIPRSYRGHRSGHVKLYGREIGEMALVDISQVVGTLLQDPERQIVSSNVTGEISFGPENLGLPREEIIQRLEEVIQRLRIEHLRGRETFNLSGGEKQKVALAGVLAMRPSILLLDEPLASLDPTSAFEALLLFRRLADEGTTILIVEHRVEDALQLKPDRLMYMDQGVVRYLGPVNETLDALDHHLVKLPVQWVLQRVRAESRESIQIGLSSQSVATIAAPPIGSGAPIEKQEPVKPSPVVSFQNVSFAYGDGPKILQDINLDIFSGDLIAILGPNGAGKSTLVKHAIGLLKPNRGRVMVYGRDTRQISVAQNARSIGYVFQSPTHMLFAPTVREELAFGPQNLRYPKEDIQRNVETSITAVNLVGLEDYPPLGLSFGQQKRTGIAAVLAMRSRIMVMDEPTAGQDYANYNRFMDTLTRATEEGGHSLLATHFDATLFITHDVDLAVMFANRVILITAGKVAADGPPEQVLCDFDTLARARIRPTSLLELNCRLLAQTRAFLPAEKLAQYVES